MLLVILFALQACLDPVTAEFPICYVPFSVAPRPKTMECWSIPIDSCPGWTWEACDGMPACKCFGDDCWCKGDHFKEP